MANVDCGEFTIPVVYATNELPATPDGASIAGASMSTSSGGPSTVSSDGTSGISSSSTPANIGKSCQPGGPSGTNHGPWATQNLTNKICARFAELVLDVVDKKTRDAIESNEEITETREFRHVKMSIEKRLLELLKEHSTRTDVPKIEFFRKLVEILAEKYPYMYSSNPMAVVDGKEERLFDSRGTGGLHGVETLPKVLQEKFRAIQKSSAFPLNPVDADVEDEEEEEEAGGKAKRRKYVYGLDQNKYYSSAGKTTKTRLSAKLQKVRQFEEREELYSNSRSSVQNMLTTSEDFYTAVPGFFEDPRHCRNQFEWMASGITKNVDRRID